MGRRLWGEEKRTKNGRDEKIDRFIKKILQEGGGDCGFGGKILGEKATVNLRTRQTG